MGEKIIKKYTSGDLTVVWQPDLCIHSRNCFKGLPNVFNPSNRPWVTIENEDHDTIRKQIALCPSGALSIASSEVEAPSVDPTSGFRVEVMPNGPLLVHGNLCILQPDGSEILKNSVTAFCRCG